MTISNLNNMDKILHKHEYEVQSEYVSTGKNLIGVKVTATMERVICKTCQEDNIRLKKKIWN